MANMNFDDLANSTFERMALYDAMSKAGVDDAEKPKWASARRVIAKMMDEAASRGEPIAEEHLQELLKMHKVPRACLDIKPVEIRDISIDDARKQATARIDGVEVRVDASDSTAF